ncbi:MAG TPA: GNAT family N-acetyltransferase [Rubrobacteraceae bacterium]|nr:GNAT family N-acetyltransferase [Rubrobacteraceae bacterium]
MVRVEPATGDGLEAPLKLLEEFLRDGEPVPETLVATLQEVVERGDLEVLAAYEDAGAIGVLVLSYRLNVSAGGRFASIEELYVRPEARRRGAGKALLEAAGERCRARGISYVEAQAVEEAATFYAMAGYEGEEGVRVMSQSYPL